MPNYFDAFKKFREKFNPSFGKEKYKKNYRTIKFRDKKESFDEFIIKSSISKIFFDKNDSFATELNINNYEKADIINSSKDIIIFIKKDKIIINKKVYILDKELVKNLLNIKEKLENILFLH